MKVTKTSLALELDVVDEAERDEVEPQLGVDDLFQRLVDLFFGWHALDTDPQFGLDLRFGRGARVAGVGSRACIETAAGGRVRGRHPDPHDPPLAVGLGCDPGDSRLLAGELVASALCLFAGHADRIRRRERRALGSLGDVVLLLIAVFIVVPIVELYVIIQVGGSIGIGPTIFLLLLDSILGALLLRSPGPLGVGVLQPRAGREPRARQGGARRGPDHLRRRAAADPRASSPTSSACCC